MAGRSPRQDRARAGIRAGLHTLAARLNRMIGERAEARNAAERATREFERIRQHEEIMNRFFMQTAEERYLIQPQRTTVSAEAIARKLLLQHLTPRQRRQLAKHNWLEVSGPKTGHVYRIHAHKFLGNIWDIPNSCKYCLYAKGDHSLPISDHVLAQKLLIETDERRFLRLANRVPL